MSRSPSLIPILRRLESDWIGLYRNFACVLSISQCSHLAALFRTLINGNAKMFQFLQAVRGCKSNDKPPTGVDSRKLEPEPKPEPKPEPDHPGWIVLATRVCRQFVCHFISFSLPGLILVQKPFSKHFPITQAWAANGLLKLQVGVTAIFRWCSPQTCDQLFPDFHTLCVTHVRRHVSAAVSQQPPPKTPIISSVWAGTADGWAATFKIDWRRAVADW